MNAAWGLGQATSNYRMALDLSPNNPVLHGNLAQSLLNQGLFDEVLSLSPSCSLLPSLRACIPCRVQLVQYVQVLACMLVPLHASASASSHARLGVPARISYAMPSPSPWPFWKNVNVPGLFAQTGGHLRTHCRSVKGLENTLMHAVHAVASASLPLRLRRCLPISALPTSGCVFVITLREGRGEASQRRKHTV